MSNQGDWGETELDETERADADINLDDPSAGDDEPWSPPDRQPRGAELVDVEDETLSMRVMQEEPDPAATVTDEPMVGGDDPLAIPADQDVLGGDADEDESFDLDGDPGPESRGMHLE
ncbi:hypothetical protein [Nocardioides currus]|uniref:DUF5709 domain-containing protein n=1 Tax=Nocardioides currus TaxID=2133958 RepID=A0A2R7YY34_9ACTN|nr:hypothetical protein [Nocardioides currus]PUA81251.1 hypothetical protein C7S10_09470 [Nocardioides currus]